MSGTRQPTTQFESLTQKIQRVDISKNGAQHGDVSLGNPDDFVDEGDRFWLNYGSTSGHPNACDGHFMYVNHLFIMRFSVAD